MNASKEQRKHERFKSFHVMKAMGPSGREIQSQEPALINMSEGGLLFYSNESVDAQSKIRIHIEIPEFNSSLMVGAEVKWVQPAMERANSYFVGAQFVDLAETDRGVIQKLKSKSKST